MRFLTAVLISLICLTGSAQTDRFDSTLAIPMFQVFAGIQKGEADLASRFGWNTMAGGSFLMKTKKGFLYGAEGLFQFGDNIKEAGIIDHLKSEGGFVISQSGMAMDVFLYQRGFQFFAKAGYQFPYLRLNPNSGPFIVGGVGFWQHKIRLEMKYGESPSLAPEYLKGYDRLTNGPAFTQQIGYQFFSRHRLINFFVAAEVTEGLMKGRRTILFDTAEPGNLSRFDMQYGFRFGWSIPMYERRKSSSRYYYY